MERFSKKIEVRWSDLDPNFHLRHSVYYDWGAFVRIALMNECGLTPAVMQQENIGPILFREECVFKREVHFNDMIEVNVQLLKSTSNAGRWTMMHEVWKNGDSLSAIITIDAAWMNTTLRKLTVPPETFKQAFENIPKADNFEWLAK